MLMLSDDADERTVVEPAVPVEETTETCEIEPVTAAQSTPEDLDSLRRVISAKPWDFRIPSSCKRIDLVGSERSFGRLSRR